MNTLGVTEEKEYLKVNIAKIQLNEAIAMFCAEKFVLSISLAGASEEILAGLLKSEGKPPALEKSISQINLFRDNLDINVANNKKKRDIINEWNHVKNRTKHHDKDECESIKFNACDESYWLIKRALSNAKDLNVIISNEQDFNNWVIMKACL